METVTKKKILFVILFVLALLFIGSGLVNCILGFRAIEKRAYDRGVSDANAPAAYDRGVNDAITSVIRKAQAGEVVINTASGPVVLIKAEQKNSLVRQKGVQNEPNTP